MEHENHIVELFVGYAYLQKDKQEMLANCSVTLVKGKNKIIVVSLKFIIFEKFEIFSHYDGIILVRHVDSLGSRITFKRSKRASCET